MSSDGLGGIRELVTQLRLERLESEVQELRELKKDLAAEASLKLERGQPVSRAEAAAFLGVSTKKLQRMEAQGKLRRLPDLGGVVLYAARDVLRLASAR
jgi:hypothetical protein